MKNNAPARNTLEAHKKRYQAARADLLIMIVLTVANIVLLFVGSDTMMLFSAMIPYISVINGYFYNGGIIYYVIAAVVIALYILCWFMSKKKYPWLIVATVLFALDSVYLVELCVVSGDFASSTIDFIIHALVLYYLIAGIITGKKLKEIEGSSDSLGEGISDEFCSDCEVNRDYDGNTTYIRRADAEVKHRVLAEAEYNGHHICYRRVKRINELIVDGYVYDEIEMLVETPHKLTAVINGETIQAGITSSSISYIDVNGNRIAKKLRLI